MVWIEDDMMRRFGRRYSVSGCSQCVDNKVLSVSEGVYWVGVLRCAYRDADEMVFIDPS